MASFILFLSETYFSKGVKKRMIKFSYFAFVLFLLGSCSRSGNEANKFRLLPIEHAILHDTASFFYIDFAKYPTSRNEMPVGVFDSGTGGLTILDAIVRFDEYNNEFHQRGGDGLADFAREDFIYLADQANMPYGNYHATGKTDLLQEHIIKDFQFLLSDRYYTNSADEVLKRKRPVKAIVVACNTATAYGYEHGVDFIEKTGIDIPVIGVINAAVSGTLDKFGQQENGAIGVFATVGTIASEGYERTLREMLSQSGYGGRIQIVNQGGHGLAEAVDGEIDYINREITAPRDFYRGPALDNEVHRIERELLPVYNFDFSNNHMLCDTENADDCRVLQINSAENYIRYHLVTLLENLKNRDDPQPLKALILGCTHYPYVRKEIEMVLAELRDLHDVDGETHRYRDLISEKVHIIDPAVYVAKELYASLSERQLFNRDGNMVSGSEFYISVPNKRNQNVRLDSVGRFTYDYKYGRMAGDIQEYTRVVPFDNGNVSQETSHRLKQTIPDTYHLIDNFMFNQQKTTANDRN